MANLDDRKKKIIFSKTFSLVLRIKLTFFHNIQRNHLLLILCAVFMAQTQKAHISKGQNAILLKFYEELYDSNSILLLDAKEFSDVQRKKFKYKKYQCVMLCVLTCTVQ